MTDITALSPARQRLSALMAERDAATAEMADLQVRMDRLATIVAAVAPARERLVDFDAAHAAALSAWASGREPAQPRSDAKQRAKLADALATAELDAHAAELARAALAAEQDRVGHKVRDAYSEMTKLAKLILVEELHRLLPEVEASRAVADALQQRFDRARAEIIGGFAFGRGDTEVLGALERFEKARHLAETSKAEPLDSSHDEWRKFTRALMQNAETSFEAAQEVELPPLPAQPAALDHATAQVRGIEAFHSTSVGTW